MIIESGSLDSREIRYSFSPKVWKAEKPMVLVLV